MEGHLDIAKYLVGMKANIEARDVRDCTSLLWSSMEGHLDITKYLVGMKANFEAEDSNSGYSSSSSNG